MLITHHGKDSKLAIALGQDFKGKISLLIYLVGLFLAFVNSWAAFALYVLVAIVGFIPDRRIEKILNS
jgi:hypothetical protein